MYIVEQIGTFTPLFVERLVSDITEAFTEMSKRKTNGDGELGEGTIEVPPFLEALIAHLFVQVFRRECDYFRDIGGKLTIEASKLFDLIDAANALLRTASTGEPTNREKILALPVSAIEFKEKGLLARFYSALNCIAREKSLDPIASIKDFLNACPTPREFEQTPMVGKGKVFLNVNAWMVSHGLW